MENLKPLLQSKTVWANIVSAGLIALQLTGKDTAGIDPQGLSGALADGAAVLLNLVSIFGRATATTQISGIVKVRS